MPCSRTQHGLTRVGLETATSGSGVEGNNHQATALPSQAQVVFVCLFGLMLHVPVSIFSVMLGWGHRFLGITSTFLGGKYILLKDTSRRPE